MTTADELRQIAREAFELSEGARMVADVQWFLKLRRVASAAADQLEPQGPAVVRLPTRMRRVKRGEVW